MTFALFFLGEYANIWLMSAMTSILFLGGWLPIFGWEPFEAGSAGRSSGMASGSR